jgi:CBS domain-containing protein
MIARAACGWIPAVCAVVLIGVLVGGGGTSYSAPIGTELPARDTEEAGSTVFLPLVTVAPRLTPEQAAEYLAANTYTDPKYNLPPDDYLRGVIEETANKGFGFITEGDVVERVKDALPEEFRDNVYIGQLYVRLMTTGRFVVQVPIMTLPLDERLRHEDYVAVLDAVEEVEKEMFGSGGFYEATGFLMQFNVRNNPSGKRVVIDFLSPEIDNPEDYERLLFDDKKRLIRELVDIPGFTE